MLHNATAYSASMVNLSDNRKLQPMFQIERCCCNVQRLGVFCGQFFWSQYYCHAVF